MRPPGHGRRSTPVKIGARCILHSAAVVGSDGFGFATDKKLGEHIKIPQVGIVVIEDDVEIGASTTIDRAAFGETRIGRDAKIDNLVQIGHNVARRQGLLPRLPERDRGHHQGRATTSRSPRRRARRATSRSARAVDRGAVRRRRGRSRGRAGGRHAGDRGEAGLRYHRVLRHLPEMRTTLRRLEQRVRDLEAELDIPSSVRQPSERRIAVTGPRPNPARRRSRSLPAGAASRSSSPRRQAPRPPRRRPRDRGERGPASSRGRSTASTGSGPARLGRMKRLLRAEGATARGHGGRREEGGDVHASPRPPLPARPHVLQGLVPRRSPTRRTRRSSRTYARFLEEQGVRLMPITELCPELLGPRGPLAGREPSEEEARDLAFGFGVAASSRVSISDSPSS